MDPRAKDLSGLTFGFLTAEKYLGPGKRGALWQVRCVCGATKAMPSGDISKSIERGRKASCGCKTKETISSATRRHGMFGTAPYSTWCSMVARCTKPSHHAWVNYGGRGIKVCEPWRSSFAAFWADMGPTWQPGLTLERKENQRGYEPENCIWTTMARQQNNSRHNTMVDTPAGRMSLADAARHYGVKYATVMGRKRRGWTNLRALGLSST